MFLLILFLPLLNSLFYSSWNMATYIAHCCRPNFFQKINTQQYESYYFVFLIIFFLNCCMFFICWNFLKTGLIIEIKLYEWCMSDLFFVNFGLLFDGITIIMLFVVILISSIVHIYSLDYMLRDPNLFKFISYLSLFTFFMLILITADNFIQLFFGWEGVGLCSYLLINFWHTRLQANKSALKAIIVNRIGDFGLIVAISLIYYTFKTVNYYAVFALIPYFLYQNIYISSLSINIIDLISFFLFFSAIGKSAQVGLHIWLPDAMEGPTPVSALIHAATMVTAGVFLIIRCSPIFEYSPKILFFMVILGSITSLLGATIGLFQYDIKKVIAYSTCSQLGYMIFACGTSNYIISLFHLTTHAFFKALLFLSAGIIIHALQDEQDMRKYGNLRLLLPTVYCFFLIGSLALCGFPFFSGFYSKEMIIEYSYGVYFFNSHFAFWIGNFSAFCTSFYSFKILYLTFYNSSTIISTSLRSIHLPSFIVLICLIPLVFGSIFGGFFLKDIFNNSNNLFFGNSIFILYSNTSNLDFEYINWNMKINPLIFSMAGIFFCYIFHRNIYIFKLSNFVSLINFLYFTCINQQNIFAYDLKFQKRQYRFFFLLILYFPIIFFFILMKLINYLRFQIIFFFSFLNYIVFFPSYYTLFEGFKEIKHNVFIKLLIIKGFNNRYKFLLEQYKKWRLLDEEFFKKNLITQHINTFQSNINLNLENLFLNYKNESKELVYNLFPFNFILSISIYSKILKLIMLNFFNIIIHFFIFISVVFSYFLNFVYIVLVKSLLKRKLMIILFFQKKWFFDKLYNNYINSLIFKISKTIYIEFMDKGLIEFFGPTGFVNFSKEVIIKIARFHTGIIYNVICLLFISACLIFFFF